MSEHDDDIYKGVDLDDLFGGADLVDIKVDGGELPERYHVYVCPAAAAEETPDLIPPAFRGSKLRLPERVMDASLHVYVMVAIDDDQERYLTGGDSRIGVWMPLGDRMQDGDIINRAVVHLVFADGTEVSHFDTAEQASAVGKWVCGEQGVTWPGGRVTSG
jgi:hypothetical protein